MLSVSPLLTRALVHLFSVKLPKIYPITDFRISGIPLADQAERLIAGGAKLIQLREKHASPQEFYYAASEAIKIAKIYKVPIIINDRVDIALALEADGVHLGQDDMPPAMARAMLGESAVIGFSTHSLEQARAALKLPVDYIAFGPIFETKTKDGAEAVVGLNGLREIRDAIDDFPLVAIGGINGDNLSSVFGAGADSVAIIGALLTDHTEIVRRMKEFTRRAVNSV